MGVDRSVESTSGAVKRDEKVRSACQKWLETDFLGITQRVDAVKLSQVVIATIAAIGKIADASESSQSWQSFSAQYPCPM